MNFIFSLIDFDSLIRRMFPSWQKYVSGVNMTVIDCIPSLYNNTIKKGLKNPNCTVSIKDWQLTTYVQTKSVIFKFIINFYVSLLII